MTNEGSELDEELAAVRYTVQINSGRVTVRRYDGGDDYRYDIEETFSKFEQGEVKDRRVEYPALSDLNHVEAQVLDLVAELFPDPFGRGGTTLAAGDRKPSRPHSVSATGRQALDFREQASPSVIPNCASSLFSWL